MNLSITKESLVQILFLTASIAQKKNAMPILANVKITATSSDTLQIVASDIATNLSAEVPAKVKEPGSITVDARVFYDIVKELPNYPVNLHVTKKSRLEIECGQSRFKIVVSSADEYPEIKGITLTDFTTVKTSKLIDMIDRTVFAVCLDDTRFNINGVYAETIEGPLGPKKMCLRFVATDGHRMAIIDRAADGFELNEPVIIPRKGVLELKKVLEESGADESKVSVANGFITVESGVSTIGINLVDGKFPDYKQVLPTNTTTKIELDRSSFLSAIKRVSLVTSDKSRAVKFKLLDGNLLISSASPEYGEASENLDVEQEGENVTTGFSGKFLLEMIVSISDSDKIIMKLDGDSSPGVFSGENDSLYESIIMPMRFE